MKMRAWALLSLLWVGAVLGKGKEPWQEYDKQIQASSTIAVLGPGLFGDQVNLYNNALSFSVTDISLPGNSGLPVALTRTFAVGSHASQGSEFPLSDWDLDLPRISGVFAPSWPNQRCTSSQAPPTVLAGATSYDAADYWQGNHAAIPNGGEMLVADQTTAKPSTGGPYTWLTPGLTYFSCLPTIKNGAGEGFLALTPDGTKYWFDAMARFRQPDLNSPVTATASPSPLPRYLNVLYATRVEDRFGNWVTYSYSNNSTSPGRLTSILASDGRQITLTYNAQGLLATASNGSQTWTYQYGSPLPTLAAVILPDSTRWTINLAPLSYAEIVYDGDQLARDCDTISAFLSGGGTGTVTHPSGAIGEFEVRPARHARSNVPRFCVNWETPINNESNDIAWFPRNYDLLSLKTKRISGPGLSTLQWNYTSAGGFGTWIDPNSYKCDTATCADPVCLSDNCAGAVSTVVTGPDGDWLRYTYGNSYRYNEGLLTFVEHGTSATNILQKTQMSYNLAQSGQAFPTPIGRSLQIRSDGFTAEQLRPQARKDTTQDGAVLTWAVNAFDVLARPVLATRSSVGSVGGNFSRTETTTYYDNASKWVLGQVAKVTDGATAKVISQTDYDPTLNLPIRTYQFGILQQTLAYNADGTLATVKDGLNNTVTLSNWYRSVPRSIAYPTAFSESAVVNPTGTIASTTDELGFSHSYGYDAMGRQTSVIYPSGDSVVWNGTTRSFAPVAVAEYGLPAGHWKSVVKTGNGWATTFYDALWRPVLLLTEDTALATSKSFVVKRYDGSGQVTFTSYPVAVLSSVSDTLNGVTTAYDALDRVLQVKQNSELGLLTTTTAYLTGFQTQVTNPRAFQTLTSYQLFDAPSTDAPVSIVRAAGQAVQQTTTISRDGFGKPQSVTRTGPGS